MNILITLSAFAVAAAWIIISASQHSTAKSKCLLDFFPETSQSSEGDTLCEIFPWVDVGIMGGLWVVLGILHVGYLSVVALWVQLTTFEDISFRRIVLLRLRPTA
jgi:hypothetical protein